jgi:hypothetical protein
MSLRPQEKVQKDLIPSQPRWGMWPRPSQGTQRVLFLVCLLIVLSGIVMGLVFWFQQGKCDEGVLILKFLGGLGVSIWLVNNLLSKWGSPDFVREVRRPLCTCALAFVFILFPSWWTGVPLAIQAFVLPMVNYLRSIWGTPEFAWEIADIVGFLTLFFLLLRFPSWWMAILLGIQIFVFPRVRYHYLDRNLYSKWKIAWSVLEEIILGRCYDCRSQEDGRGRQVLICVPVSEEERKRRTEEYCKEHFGDVSEDTESEPEKREHRWIQEHPYPKKFVLNPYKSLLVLKSKKGFGVWNTEINAQYQQVSFQKDTVVVQCAFLNPDGSSMSQECEYRIPWKKGTAPRSGLLRKSGKILIRPYDQENAFPEYYVIDSQPSAE